MIRSSCSVDVEWIEFSSSRIYENNLVSSAKREIKFVVWSDMLVTKIRNNTGPNTEPWGTPLRTGDDDDKEVLTLTACLRFDRKLVIQPRT